MEDKVLKEVLQVMLDNKAEDLVYLNVAKVNPLAEYYIICTVSSNRQALALARYVDDCLAKNNIIFKVKVMMYFIITLQHQFFQF